MSPLPKDLVQYVARDLIERALSIKKTPRLMREISSHPLPVSAFKNIGLTAPLVQWRMVNSEHNNSSPWWEKLNPFHQNATVYQQAQLLQSVDHEPRADLVFAPLVLDGAKDVLATLSQLPHWFSDDGVLLFAILGAGGLPEIVNAQPEWLDLLSHWPNIMDTGARLQELRFGLPVLDVETVTLSYENLEVLWADVLKFIPILNALNDDERLVWKKRLQALFEQGLRAVSLQVIYAQVWQVSAPRYANETHTVSLESLTAQLPHRKTFAE